MGRKEINFTYSSEQPFSTNCIYTFINRHNIVDFYMETSELIKEAKQGSAAAQKCLFDQWAEKMLLVCRRYVKNSEDAEELLLDGFISSLKK
jgi:hypothetical protein